MPRTHAARLLSLVRRLFAAGGVGAPHDPWLARDAGLPAPRRRRYLNPLVAAFLH